MRLKDEVMNRRLYLSQSLCVTICPSVSPVCRWRERRLRCPKRSRFVVCIFCFQIGPTTCVLDDRVTHYKVNLYQIKSHFLAFTLRWFHRPA